MTMMTDSQAQTRYPLWRALILPWTLILIFFWPILFSAVPLNADWLAMNFYPWKNPDIVRCHNPEIDDPILEYYPLACRAAESLRKGIIPLWNPQIGCGVPQFGDFHSLPFDPLFLMSFMIISNNPTAWAVFILLQFFVMTAAMAGFLRSRDVSAWGASLGAICLAFSGPVVTRCTLRTFAGALIGMFFALWALENRFNARKQWYLFLAAAALATTLYAGHIQFTFYSWILISGYCIYRNLAAFSWRSLIRAVSDTMILWSLALLISMPSWLSELELLVRTLRGDPGRYFPSFRFSWGPWLTFLSPDILGHPADGNYFGLYIYYKSYINLPVLYIGIIPLLMVIYAFGTKTKGVAFFGSSLMGILTFLTILNIRWVRTAAFTIWPSLFSMEPGRLAMLVAPLACILAAEGASMFFRAHRHKWDRQLIVLPPVTLIGLISLGSGILWLFRKPFYQIAQDNSLLLYYLKLQNDHGLLLLTPQIRTCMVFLMLSIAIMILARSNKMTPRIPAGLMMLLVAGDLLPVSAKYNPFVRWDVMSVSDDIMTNWPQTGPFSGRLLGIDGNHSRDNAGEILPPNSNLYFGSYDFRAYMSTPPARLLELLNMIEPRSYFDRRLSLKARPLFEMAGVRWLLTAPYHQIDGLSLRNETPGIRIYENQNAFEKGWLVPNIYPMESLEKMWAAVTSGELDWHRDAMVEGIPAESILQSESDPTNETVRLVKATDHYLEFQVDALMNTFLVVNDTYYPGWQVTVNDQPQRIYPANHAFRGVFLAGGHSVVKMYYKPISFLLGGFSLALSVLGYGVIGSRYGR